MPDSDLFFAERNGEVWACYLSGKPPLNLGSVADVRTAMAEFSVLAGAQSTQPHANAEPPANAEEPSSPGAPSPPPAPPPQPARAVRERAEQRFGLTLMGRIFMSGGSREVTVLDLSESGCRFRDASGHITDGTRLSIKLGPVGPVEAVVMWAEGSFVGIRFANPLYPSVMRHIRETIAFRS